MSSVEQKILLKTINYNLDDSETYNVHENLSKDELLRLVIGEESRKIKKLEVHSHQLDDNVLMNMARMSLVDLKIRGNMEHIGPMGMSSLASIKTLTNLTFDSNNMISNIKLNSLVQTSTIKYISFINCSMITINIIDLILHKINTLEVIVFNMCTFNNRATEHVKSHIVARSIQEEFNTYRIETFNPTDKKLSIRRIQFIDDHYYLLQQQLANNQHMNQLNQQQYDINNFTFGEMEQMVNNSW